MFGKWLIAVSLILAVGAVAAEGTSKSDEGVVKRTAQAVTAKVVKVIDGDTVEISDEGGSVRTQVHLDGIDAPELKQSGGEESRDFLAGMIGGNMVEVEYVRRDQYQRPFVNLRIDGRILNHEMVAGGWAWRCKCDEPEVVAAQRAARAAKKGLWGKSGKAQPPWEFRRDYKQRKNGRENKKRGGMAERKTVKDDGGD